MNNYLKQIREGKMPEMRSLRKKDELKGFNDELIKTIEYLINKQGK